MPLIILPGTIQLARSPFWLTSIPPSTARSICPPRIIAKLGRAVEIAVCGSWLIGLLAGVDQVGIDLVVVGERPDAEHPVLALQRDRHPCGTWLATSVGMPMPRFT